jgi:hypothetical protein
MNSYWLLLLIPIAILGTLGALHRLGVPLPGWLDTIGEYAWEAAAFLVGMLFMRWLTGSEGKGGKGKQPPPDSPPEPEPVEPLHEVNDVLEENQSDVDEMDNREVFDELRKELDSN